MITHKTCSFGMSRDDSRTLFGLTAVKLLVLHVLKTQYILTTVPDTYLAYTRYLLYWMTVVPEFVMILCCVCVCVCVGVCVCVDGCGLCACDACV